MSGSPGRPLDTVIVMGQLETVSRESLQLFESLRRESSRHMEELRAVGSSGWKEREEAALAVAERLGLSTQQSAVALFVRATADYAHQAVDPTWSGLSGRLQEVERDARELGDLAEKYGKLKEERLPQIKGTVSMDKTDRVYRQRFDFAVRTHCAELQLMLDGVERVTAQARAAAPLLQRGPEWMVVEVYDGQVHACHAPVADLGTLESGVVAGSR
jgi:hypothetical protein